MGVTVRGMAEWLAVLDSLPERAPKAFRPVVSRAGVQMKLDWRGRWQGMPHAHIPHLVRALGYDTSERGMVFTVEVGVDARKLQARLASFIEYGTLTNRPHPGGLPALEAETPRMASAAEQVGVDLLEGRA